MDMDADDNEGDDGIIVLVSSCHFCPVIKAQQKTMLVELAVRASSTLVIVDGAFQATRRAKLFAISGEHSYPQVRTTKLRWRLQSVCNALLCGQVFVRTDGTLRPVRDICSLITMQTFGAHRTLRQRTALLGCESLGKRSFSGDAAALVVDFGCGTMHVGGFAGETQPIYAARPASQSLKSGIVTDWHAMELGWRELFIGCGVDSKETPVVWIEPPLNPRSNRDRMLALLFETFDVPAVHIAIASVLPLYAAGQKSGCVLHSGEDFSFTCPAYEVWSTIFSERAL